VHTHRDLRDFQSGRRAVRQAIANFGGDNSRLWLALVGKARALLDLNQPAAAAALLAPVPDTFKYVVQHSAASQREQNGTTSSTPSRSAGPCPTWKVATASHS